MSAPIDPLQVSYDAGYDAGKNGSNTTNCHFSLFSSPERTRAWERGKAAGEKWHQSTIPNEERKGQ